MIFAEFVAYLLFTLLYYMIVAPIITAIWLIQCIDHVDYDNLLRAWFYPIQMLRDRRWP
jgi:hypothetical protein